MNPAAEPGGTGLDPQAVHGAFFRGGAIARGRRALASQRRNPLVRQAACERRSPANPAGLRAGLVLSFLLFSCALPPEEKPQAQPEPPAYIDLLLTADARSAPFEEERASAPLAELRGTELFSRDITAIEPLVGVRFDFRVSRTDAPPSPEKKTPAGTGPAGDRPAGATKTTPPAPSSPANPAEPAGTRSNTVGRYVTKDAPARRPRELPTVSCGPGIEGNETVSLGGLADGAARKALRILREEGERELTLIADESDYGRRGRRLIAREAGLLGMTARPTVLSSAEAKGLRDALRDARGKPVLAWLDRDGAESLIQAARDAAYAGKILLGPAAVDPLLASPPERRWSAQEMKPPAAEPGEAILAVGHKLAAAEALGEDDPVKRRLERFRDAYFASFRQPPSLLSACVYDALSLLMESLVGVADPKDIPAMGTRALARMRGRKTLEGTLGTYRLTGGEGLPKEGALGEESFLLLRALDGKWTPFQAPGGRLPGFKE